MGELATPCWQSSSAAARGLTVKLEHCARAPAMSWCHIYPGNIHTYKHTYILKLFMYMESLVVDFCMVSVVV